MNAASHDPDIRVGDLVKATHREIPEHAIQGRVRRVTDSGCAVGMLYPGYSRWDFEVLDRPLPPVEEELIRGASNTYAGRPADYDHQTFYRDDWINVINFIREYDRNNNNKESK